MVVVAATWTGTDAFVFAVNGGADRVLNFANCRSDERSVRRYPNI
jgi:hypothetical protein